MPSQAQNLARYTSTPRRSVATIAVSGRILSPWRDAEQQRRSAAPMAKRWSSRRKAAVVIAVRDGAITREEAYGRYLLSEVELAGWEAAYERRTKNGEFRYYGAASDTRPAHSRKKPCRSRLLMSSDR